MKNSKFSDYSVHNKNESIKCILNIQSEFDENVFGERLGLYITSVEDLLSRELSANRRALLLNAFKRKFISGKFGSLK